MSFVIFTIFYQNRSAENLPENTAPTVAGSAQAAGLSSVDQSRFEKHLKDLKRAFKRP